MLGLKALKATLTQQLHDLAKMRPTEKSDEVLLEDLARLDARLEIAKDEAVRVDMLSLLIRVGRFQTPSQRST